MPNELVKIDDLLGGLSLDKYTEEDFNASRAGGGADFLPRIQLMTANAAKCKEGSFPTNHYALVENQSYKDLGGNVDVLIICFRPKALEIGDGVVASHDTESELFGQIVERASQPDSGCMYGPEFLVWIPSEKRFATFFMGSKSARRESPAVKSRLKAAATLGARKVTTSKYTWFAPSCVACTTPLTAAPQPEDLGRVVESFLNPPAPTAEPADTSSRSR